MRVQNGITCSPVWDKLYGKSLLQNTSEKTYYVAIIGFIGYFGFSLFMEFFLDTNLQALIMHL